LYSNLALIQKDQGDLPAARASIERSIKINEKHFAPDHPRLAISYSNLAMIQQAQGDLPGARAQHRVQHQDQREHFAPDHPTLAISYSNLAPIQKDQGDLPGARPASSGSIKIKEKHFAPDHPTLAISYNNLARIELAEGNRAAACASFRKALAILLKHFGEDHPQVKSVRENMRAAGCEEELPKAGKRQEVRRRSPPRPTRGSAATFRSLTVAAQNKPAAGRHATRTTTLPLPPPYEAGVAMRPICFCGVRAGDILMGVAPVDRGWPRRITPDGAVDEPR